MNLIHTHSISEHTKISVKHALAKVFHNAPGFLHLEENAFLQECKNVLASHKNFQHLLVLGIGGSALGTASIVKALQKDKNITILDHLNPEEIQEMFKNIDWKHTLINVISKSGGTLETAFQLAMVEETLSSIFSAEEMAKRIICTTETGSKLFEHAQKMGYATLPVPKTVGGRFSVLTPVGIFPLLFCGVDAEKLLAGAGKAREHTQCAENIAELQLEFYKHEKRNIAVFMSYHKKLMPLLDWYRQLLAESLGKNKETGVTPVLAYGSTDQHSQIQLYTEGPTDKFLCFLSQKFPHSTEKFTPLGFETGFHIEEVQEALFEGTKLSLKKAETPFYEIVLENSEESIGHFLMSHMMAIAILGEVLEINAFDQPGVEEGKIQALRILRTL